MARFFKSRIVGAERIHRLVELEGEILARVRKVVEAKARELLKRVQAKASGLVLGTRKGRLLRSLQMQTYESAAGPGAKVFSRWYVARFYEQGYGGKTVRVKRFVRQVKARNVRGDYTDKNGKTRRKKIAQGIAFVKAHDRTIPRVHKSILKSSLDEMRGSIRQALEAAAKRGV